MRLEIIDLKEENLDPFNDEFNGTDLDDLASWIGEDDQVLLHNFVNKQLNLPCVHYMYFVLQKVFRELKITKNPKQTRPRNTLST